MGAGWSCASNTYTWVLATGRPIVNASRWAVTRSTIIQMVVSVGPYKFHNSAQRGSSALASAGDRASPPHRMRRSALPGHWLASSICQVAGVACITVTSWRVSRSASWNPSFAASLEAITTLAPTLSGRYSSSPAISNDRVVTASRVSRPLIPGCSIIVYRKLTTLACVICTPFGLPVEPEV